MTQHEPAIWEHSLFREAIGSVGVLIGLLYLTDMGWQAIAPITMLTGGMLAHKIADERYDLPDGMNWIFYGVTVVAVGVFLITLDGASLGVVLVAVGCWFGLDGATKAKYEAPTTRHEYVSDLDGERAEMMLRMQTLSSVYHHLKEVDGPQTIEAVANGLDLTETRTEAALDYLETKGRVERVGTGYRANSSRWGKLSPVVRFTGWLPRRLVRPITRIGGTL